MADQASIGPDFSPFGDLVTYGRFCRRMGGPRWSRVLGHPLLRRLGQIRHYGLWAFLEPKPSAWITSTTRLNHSVNVAFLCDSWADAMALDRVSRDALLLAGLLHDVAHAPFSHSLESLFLRRANWDHNALAPRFATQVLSDVGESRDVASLTGSILERDTELSRVLFGHTGADSVENVLRGLAAVDALPVGVPDRVVRSFVTDSPVEWAWLVSRKEHLYREHFYSPRLQLFEAILQHALARVLDDSELRDPLALVDRQLEESVREVGATIADVVRQATFFAPGQGQRESRSADGGARWFRFAGRRRAFTHCRDGIRDSTEAFTWSVRVDSQEQWDLLAPFRRTLEEAEQS